MNYHDIPEGSIEVQTGLWWSYQPFTFNGNTIPYGELFAAEGYCFYDLNRAENYDEEGNLLPAANLIYEIHCTCVEETAEAINAYIVSVPYQEGYEVVNVPTNPPVTE